MPGILCEHCTAACCRYIALPIETPTERADFDDVRWYLLHENISVFVEKGDWYISIVTSCRHVQADGRCGIYARRPRICRKYTTENCDYHSGDYGWEAHFTCPEHLDEYLRAHPPLDKKSSVSKKKLKSLKLSQLSKVSHSRTTPRKKKPVSGATGRKHVDLHGRPLPRLEGER
jgi:uncharacterized protein